MSCDVVRETAESASGPWGIPPWSFWMSLIRLQIAAGVLLAGAACSHVAAQSAPPAATTGEQKTAVVLVNFVDNTTQPITPANASSLVMGQVSDFYWENSYQKTFLSGDTFGWTTAPVTMTECRWTNVVDAGNKAMLAAGKNPADYKHFIYLYPKASGCPSGGSNDVGPNGELRVYVNGAAGFTMTMIAHEMGHSFGLLHSDALDCNVSPIGDTCSMINYGDPSDTMGSTGHFNAYWKERLGWLGTQGMPPLINATQSGRYVIDRFETTGTRAKAVKVFRGIDSATGREVWYYVEYRQSIGFDTVVGDKGGNLTDGVQVRKVSPSPSGGYSQFLDMTPNSLASGDILDGALAVGRTFVDSTSGVKITLVSADGQSATLDVTVGATAPTPPPTQPPADTLTTSAGTDKTQYAKGATVYMTALVKQNGAAIGGANVTFTVTLPTGAKSTVRAVSGSDGFARGTYKLGKSKTAAGHYGIGASAALGEGSATANASFDVL
jgi:hypothetical protein